MLRSGKEYKIVLKANSVSNTGNVILSYMFSNGQNKEWSHIYNKTNAPYNEIILKIVAKKSGEIINYFDDFSLSKIDTNESEFGKYEFSNGTSLATPYVTASTVTISNIYDSKTALEKKQILMESIRSSANLKGKVKTGGTLDLSKLSNEIKPVLNLPLVEKEANWNKETKIVVQNVQQGQKYEYTINNGITWIECNDNSIILNGTDGIYQIKVRVKDNPETESNTYYYKLDTTNPTVSIDINKANEVETVSPEVTVRDERSGLKANEIQYQFSLSNVAPDGGYKTINLVDGKAKITSPIGANGTYYLYINNIEDNAGNKTDIEKFGPYILKTNIVVPKLELTTDVNNVEWKKENQTIELKDTVDGKTYKYSIDNGTSWKECIYNASTKKWKIFIDTDGKYSIKIKMDDIEIEQDYYLEIDKSRPVVEIIGEKKNPQTIKIKAYDAISGLINKKIEYILSSTDPTKDSKWAEGTIDSSGMLEIKIPEYDGIYNIYVKALTDNAGWKSIESSYHKFEGYTFDRLIPLTSISIEKNVNINEGSTRQLNITYVPETANIEDIQWKSSDENIATVKSGLVKGIKEGTSTITVQVKDKSGNTRTSSCLVNVTKVESPKVQVTSISLAKEKLSIKVGAKQKLNLTINPNEADVKSINWKSDNLSVISVDDNGNIISLRPGNARVTVTVEDSLGNVKSAKCTVTVVKESDIISSTEKDNKKAEKKDLTVANVKLPKTGMNGIIILLILILISIITYIKSKKYKDIK